MNDTAVLRDYTAWADKTTEIRAVTSRNKDRLIRGPVYPFNNLWQKSQYSFKENLETGNGKNYGFLYR